MTIFKTPVCRCASVFVFAGEPVVPASYLFLQTHFVIYDFDATLLRVLRDELAIMGLFLYLAYHTGGILQKTKKKEN